MKVYEVKYQSYNQLDYSKFISAKNEKEALKLSRKSGYLNDDRDKVINIKLDPTNGLGGYPWYK